MGLRSRLRAKRQRRQGEEGALDNESKKEQKEVEAGGEMGKLEVAFLSFFQIAYF